MTEPILATKLFIPPLRPTRVARPHLLARLDAPDHHRLILITAPAGFGKTTLLAEWARAAVAEGRAIAWLSLDAGDNDPNRFYRHIVAALQTIDEALGRGLLALLRSAPGERLKPEAAVTALINDLVAFGRPVALILDDYHLIETDRLHDALGYWLDQMPPGSRLVVASRAEPPWPLARLRVRDALTELTGRNLRFSGDESGQFLNQVMRLQLPSEDVDQLATRTEGWIASLQLAALSIQGQPDPHAYVARFAGDDRYIMDYLMGEVLDRQPAALRQFLLRTAILPRFNADLATAVSGLPDAARHIETLEQRDLFVVPLDNQRRWYRYHQLFGAFLQAQLARAYPDEVATLHRRAGAWFEAAGHSDEAIGHALGAGDFAAAAERIIAAGPQTLWREARLTTLLAWTGALPEPVRRQYPDLLLLENWALYTSGQWEPLANGLAALEQILANRPDDARRRIWQGEALVMRAERAIYRNDVAEARSYLEQAADYLRDGDGPSRAMLYQGLGYIHRLNGDLDAGRAALRRSATLSRAADNLAPQLFALYDLALLHQMAGRLDDAGTIFRQMRALFANLEGHPMLGAVAVGEAQLHLARHELRQAAAAIELALHCAHAAGLGGFVRVAHLAETSLLAARGDFDGAWDALRRAEEQADAVGAYWVTNQVAQVRAWLRLHLGETVKLTGWAAEARRPAAERPFLPTYVHHQEQILYARYCLSSGATADAWERLAALRAQAAAAGWQTALVGIDVLLAMTEAALGQGEAAARRLAAAADAAAPQRLIQPFREAAPSVADQLRAARDQASNSAFVDQLLLAIESPPALAPSQAPDALTARERQVLALMAAGLSNRAIAARLTIATGTVGKHTSNIFAKLDAPNRATAVLRAREHGLL